MDRAALGWPRPWLAFTLVGAVLATEGVLGCGGRTLPEPGYDEGSAPSGTDGQGGAAGGNPGSGCGPADIAPTIIATDQHGPLYLAIDEARIYWAHTDLAAAALVAAPKSGGAVTDLADGVLADGIVVDASYVYWAEYDNSGGVWRMPKGGGTPEQIVAGQPRAAELEQDDDELFWLATGKLENDYVDGSVVKASKAAPAASVLVAPVTQLGDLALGPDAVYYTHRTEPAGSSSSASEVVRVPKTGGTATALFAGRNAWAVAADDDAVYWSAAPNADEQYPTAVWRAGLDGADPHIIAQGDGFIAQIVVDGDCLYLSDGATPLGFGIARVPRSGGSIAPVVPYHGGNRLVLDQSALYFTRYQDDTVLRAPKD